MLDSSQTWADMSISRGRDNLLPSSVFRKSSKHPKEREAASALLQKDPSPAVPASPRCGLLPAWRQEARGTWSDRSSTKNQTTHSGGVLSALQKFESRSSEHPRGQLLCFQGLRGRSVSTRFRATQPGSQEQNLLFRLLSLVPIPGMTFQSVFLSPSPFIGRNSAFEDQRCKKMPEQRDLPPRVWCRGQILLHHGI